MKLTDLPITDDHIHIDPVNGRGVEAAKDFKRAGGTHLFLVTKPSWSYGITPSRGGDFRDVYERTLRVAKEVAEIDLVVYPVLGVHPAEITRMCERMALEEAVEVMKEALTLASTYVHNGQAIALKSGRPHYPVDSRIWDASNTVLSHALILGAESDCAVQIHAESGPCSDVVSMAHDAKIPLVRVVKHFATPDTPLSPSLIAKHEAIPALARQGRIFTMESDYMDEHSRPGAVIGPKSVPRFTRRLLENEAISLEDAYRIHAESPNRMYGVEIG
jgi:TatD-related deoxyribonuclease